MATSGGFWRRPQSLPWRRVLFQVHLWTGLAIGLYILVISVSGSAIVFRRELDKALCPQIIMVAPHGQRLSPAQLTLAAQRVFHRIPRFNPALVRIRGARVAGAAIEVWYPFAGGRGRVERLIDPYSGRDLGDTVACEPPVIGRIADLHDELLGGETGTAINGAGALLLTLMCLSGSILWWPGRSRWQRSLTVRAGVGWRRFVWDLHSMLGFWLFALLLMWAVSAIYLAFPNSFYDIGDFLAAHGIGTRRGHRLDVFIDWMVRLHFGRSFGGEIKVLWVLLGLAPGALILTGGLMWWNRVVRRVMGRGGESANESAGESAAQGAGEATSPAGAPLPPAVPVLPASAVPAGSPLAAPP